MFDMSRIATLRERMRAALQQDRGMALMLVLMIMMLLSALMIGFMTSIMADTRSSGVDRDETQAYAVAHAGMEKLTSDLSALFLSDYSPNGTQISAKTAYPPVIPGFLYIDPDGTTGYKVQFTAKAGAAVCTPSTALTNCIVVATPTTAIPVPDDPSTGTTIAAGPYQGFKGLVTHYNIMVTARSTAAPRSGCGASCRPSPCRCSSSACSRRAASRSTPAPISTSADESTPTATSS